MTQGTLEGDIAQGEVLPVRTRSFGSIGVFAIPEMGRFYRHVLIEKNFPHHGAVAFGHFGKTLYEVFKYMGVPVEEIHYNQPAGMRYPMEIIAASVRNPVHVTECALAGADIATVPYKVLEQMIKHPLTDQGIEKFKKDYKAVFGE